MPLDLVISPEPFSLDGIIAVARGGSLAPAWLDAYGAYLRRSHARAAAEIAETLCEAGNGSATSGRPVEAR